MLQKVSVLIGWLLLSSVIQAAPAQDRFQYHMDQLLGNLEDRRLAQQLELRRSEILTGFEVWCAEQIDCPIEALKVDDVLGFVNVLGTHENDDVQLKILLNRALAGIAGTPLESQVRQHREEFIKGFKRWCSAQLLACAFKEVSVDQLSQFLHQWSPGALIQGVTEINGSDNGPVIPDPYWDCSDFRHDEDNTVRYGWLYWRDVRIFFNPEKAKRLQGPLVYYWHGSNETWSQVFRVLGRYVIDEIVAEGGIVVAPHAGAPAALPWYIMNPVTAGLENDFYLADQIAACAEQLYDIDETRIYSMGFSAGGLQSAAMGRFRSNYVAAIASYSGGQLPWYSLFFSQAVHNYYKAYISYGTPGQDNVPGVEFADTSESLVGYLEWRGFHELMVCQQERGHTMPYKTMKRGWNYIKSARYRRLDAAETSVFVSADVTRNDPYWCY